jgi:type IV fimbrial biogenesis protein FimT
MSRQGPREDERGFTLVEVMVTIIMMGIVFAIASASWFDVVESRQVDSATNQLAADMRLAHSRATNRLEDWQIVLADDSSIYTIGPVGSPADQDLDDDPAGDEVVVDTAATITFKGDGSAVLPGGASSATYTVCLDNGDPCDTTNDPNHEITIDKAISRIQIDP